MGLAYDSRMKKFAYGIVRYDGGGLYASHSWDSKEKFIEWLEKWSDDSLSTK